MARGDHIYVDGWCAGVPFQHHGIDMGDGTVIHLAPEAGPRVTLRDSSGRFAVRCVTLEQFAGGQSVQVVQDADRLPADQVADRAQAMLGQTGYSLLGGNCEHFASYCANGRLVSRQIDMASAAMVSATSAATKVVWSVAARTGLRTVVRGAVRIHPSSLLADGVEALMLAAGCNRGLTAERSKKLARVSGNLTAVGVGAVVGGPMGAVAALAVHRSSTAFADGICQTLHQLLK